MRLARPIGSQTFGPLMCRLPLGFFLFLSGIWGIQDPALFLAKVEKYANSSGFFFSSYGTVAPYLAIGTGALLILGLLTTGAAMISSFLLMPLAIASGVFSQGLNDLTPYIEHRTLFRDLVLLGVSLSLLFTGAGAFSIDRLLERVYRDSEDEQ